MTLVSGDKEVVFDGSWDIAKPLNVSLRCVSKSSFGHTGFTGTMAWADPVSEIVFVFLSNRTYPDSNSTNTLSKENIREDIQKVIQESIIE